MTESLKGKNEKRTTELEWKTFLSLIVENVSALDYMAWFKPLSLHEIDEEEGIIYIASSEEVVVKWINDNWRVLIEDVANAVWKDKKYRVVVKYINDYDSRLVNSAVEESIRYLESARASAATLVEEEVTLEAVDETLNSIFEDLKIVRESSETVYDKFLKAFAHNKYFLSVVDFADFDGFSKWAKQKVFNKADFVEDEQTDSCTLFFSKLRLRWLEMNLKFTIDALKNE